MQRQLILQQEALDTLDSLALKDAKKLRKVQTALGKMEADIQNPGLRTHKYSVIKGDNGEQVWEAYVENHTPSAYRIFWHYGPDLPDEPVITIVAIEPHPK